MENHYEIFRKTLVDYFATSDDFTIDSILDTKDPYNTYITTGGTLTISHKGLIIPCMTREGFFVINGKAWVYPWRENICPNWIYKVNRFVTVWSAKESTPWKFYTGKLKIFLKKDSIYIETNKKDVSLRDFLEFHNISFSALDNAMKKWKHIYDKFTLYTKPQKSQKPQKVPDESTCLPHLHTIEQKITFFSLMILHLVDDSIPDEEPGFHSKRLISCEWLLRQTLHIFENEPSKAYSFAIKRIISQGQLLDLKCKHEILSHTTRVIRGSGSSFGSTQKRELQSYHKGVYCPYRASEGENIGLVVDLAEGVRISMKEDAYGNTTIINGVPQQKQIPYENVRSKTWKWTDAGRIISKKDYSIGLVAQSIIFRRHLPPVRSMYATTHMRQALPLLYPQIPVIQSKGVSPNGQNVCVAVCSFEGWNIEDAIVCKDEFIQRGGLATLHTHIIQEHLYTREKWKYNVPIPKHSILEKNSSMFTKISNNESNIIKWENEKKAKVVQSHRNDKTEVLQLLTIHFPETGDKLSTRSGQKGVIGRIVDSKDMPYTQNGLVPDIIINPAHMPSRMTVSQMLESFFGKELILQGKIATEMIENEPGLNFKRLSDMSTGKDNMYCGKTGVLLKNPIFIGNVFYMPLQHMVHKKIRARNKGPIVPITGQPTQGRQAHGGLRIGEMERDALRTRGCTEIIKERLGSDIITVMVCKACGWLEPTEKCCDHMNHVQIKMPKTTILLLMEIYALGIFPKLKVG